MRQTLAAIAAWTALAAAPALASPQSGQLAQSHLYADTLAEGARDLAGLAAKDAGDGEARFGLGLVRFSQAVEHLGQNLHRYGLRPPKTVSAPILRLPVPPNPSPETLDYAGVRALLQDFATDLAAAEQALAAVGEDKAQILLDLAKVKLNFVGAGKPAAGETMAALVRRMADQRGAGAAPLTFEVKFDEGDAAWLRGYCHVLMALSEFLLAHDFHDTFDHSFQLFFPRLASPIATALAARAPASIVTEGFADSPPFADLLALVHTINWPLAEPQRMPAVRRHLKDVIALSRLSWKLIQAETGDDREWLPNPRQTHAALGETLSQRQLEAWFSVLDETEAVLDGKKLIPHWRFTKGFDLKRFFDEPQRFDLMLLGTGGGAVAFLGAGETTTRERWEEITKAFEDGFFGYALWIN